MQAVVLQRCTSFPGLKFANVDRNISLGLECIDGDGCCLLVGSCSWVKRGIFNIFNFSSFDP